jgi:hypothetical protein
VAALGRGPVAAESIGRALDLGVAATVVVGDVEWEAAEADGDLRAAAGEEELDAAAGDRGSGGNRSAGDRCPRWDARAHATRAKRMGVLGAGCSPLSLRGQETIFEGLRKKNSHWG